MPTGAGKCQGPPIGPCPSDPNAETKLCQGDMVLCAVCEEGRFGAGSARPGSAGNSLPLAGATSSDSNSDGVVVNELLCFMSNQMDCMAADLLIQLVVDFYDGQVIESAKKTLYDLVAPHRPSQRIIQRRGDKKSEKNVEDMLTLLISLEPHVIPCFVARDLANLPPLSEKQFDVAKILKELQSLRLDVRNLKQTGHSTAVAAAAISAAPEPIHDHAVQSELNNEDSDHVQSPAENEIDGHEPSVDDGNEDDNNDK